MPEDGASATRIVEFYRDTADRIVVGASLSLLGIAVFVLFAAALRRALVDAAGEGDDLLSTTAFGGALLGMAAGLGAETINMAAALRARQGELSEPLAQSLFEVSHALGSIATGVGLGVLALATAVAALRAGRVLPRWLAIVVLVVGLLSLSPLSQVDWVAGAALVAIAATVAVALFTRPAGSGS